MSGPQAPRGAKPPYTESNPSGGPGAAGEEARYLAHRIAAAITLGAVTADNPERLDWAEQESYKMEAPEIVREAVRLLVADTRLYDERDQEAANALGEQLTAALTAPSGPQDAGLTREEIEALLPERPANVSAVSRAHNKLRALLAASPREDGGNG